MSLFTSSQLWKIAETGVICTLMSASFGQTLIAVTFSGLGLVMVCLLATGVAILARITILVTKLCSLKAHICQRMQAVSSYLIEHGAAEA